MPTYEYECEKCGHRFDKFQNITEAPLKRCPQCRSKVRRLVSAGAGIIFKGSGFYATDYRSDGYRQSAKKDESSSTAAKTAESTAKTDKSKKAAAKGG